MKQVRHLKHEFVEFIPEELKEGTVYVSIAYATVVHKCCCGCGQEVITPLSPSDWELTFDGETISLSPSIGNWGFACKSHYWIRRNRVRWARRWSQEEIEAGRCADRSAKDQAFTATTTSAESTPAERTKKKGRPLKVSKLWRQLKAWRA